MKREALQASGTGQALDTESERRCREREQGENERKKEKGRKGGREKKDGNTNAIKI